MAHGGVWGLFVCLFVCLFDVVALGRFLLGGAETNFQHRLLPPPPPFFQHKTLPSQTNHHPPTPTTHPPTPHTPIHPTQHKTIPPSPPPNTKKNPPNPPNTTPQELYRLTYIPEGKSVNTDTTNPDGIPAPGACVEDAVLLLEFVGLVDEGHVNKVGFGCIHTWRGVGWG